MHTPLPKSCLESASANLKRHFKHNYRFSKWHVPTLAALLLTGIYSPAVAQPIISGMPANITVSTDPGSCDAVVNFAAPTATNSGQVVVSRSQTFNYSGSIQTFTVPAGVTSLTINALGARGGNSNGGYSNGIGGSGARIQGEFTVTSGEVLNILVGGHGVDANFNTFVLNTGGGGGSFVWKNNGTPLLIAGGGSGTGRCGMDPGQPGLATLGGLGTGGIAGTCGTSNSGGGGAGWLFNGGSTAANPNIGGITPLNGGYGGAAGVAAYGFIGTAGGFGGGAGGGGNCGGPGGGGGYTGGNGGNNCGLTVVSGGTSYNIGDNQVNQTGVNSGNGEVLISWSVSTEPTVTQTGGPVSGSVFSVGTTTVTYTATDALGNSTQSSFTVTVNDNTAPTVSCQNITVQLNANGEATITPADVQPIGSGTQTFNYTGSIQSFTVPAGVTSLSIQTWGAQGGNNGGLGAQLSGNFTVNPGEIINVLSGGMGAFASNSNGGGGGGSYVWKNNSTIPLIIAGGGGGRSGNSFNGQGGPGSGTNSASNSISGSGNGIGGQNGNGGSGGNYLGAVETYPGTGGGGAGWLSNGLSGNNATYAASGGKSVSSGGAGGVGFNPCANASVFGGFGGGGGAAGCSGASGGGGGYNGGGGGNSWNGQWGSGGGGGSYNSGTDPQNFAGVNTGNGKVVISWTLPPALSDNCGIQSQTLSQSTFTCDNRGENTVTLTVTDVNGNAATCTAIVTVLDTNHPCNEAPIAICKNITAYTTENCTAAISAADVNNNSIDPDGDALTYSISPAGPFAVGTHTVTLTVTDPSGESDQCTATVTVQDNTLPTVATNSLTVQLDPTGNASVSAAQVNNGSSDACGIAGYSLSKENFTCANVGENTVTLTVTDVNGNTNSATATITVEDLVAPVVNTNNISAQLDATGAATITTAQIDNGSSDACGIAAQSLSKTNFDCSNVGANTVVLTVTDVNGNSSSATAIVTVEDNVIPVAATKNITVQLNANGSASISASDIDHNSSDACGIASYVLDITSFDCSNVGTNNVMLTVTDNNGNSNSATAIVTVEDNVAPVATAQNVTIYLGANGQASTTAAAVNNNSSDACSIANLSLSQTDFTCANRGENTVTLTVTDNNGNINTATATVTVVDAIVPTITCGSNITVTAQPNDCSPVVTWAAPVAADNCTYTISSTHNSGDHFPVGTSTVTYTITDATGNTASCSFTVTVNPTPLVISSLSSPTFAGGFNISCNGGNNGSATVAVSGGCLPYSYSWSNGQTTATATTLAAGTYTVTVTDANSTSVQQSITLTQPTGLTMTGSLTPLVAHLNAQPNTIYVGYGPQSRTLTAAAAGGVAGYSYSWSPAAGLNTTTGASVIASPTVTTHYTVTATDANGCTKTLVHSVFVINAVCSNNANNYKVIMCHEGQTICVSENSVLSHLQHGCTIGACGPARMVEQPQLAAEPVLKAYPNPNNGNFTLEVEPETDGQVMIDMFDITGRSVGQLFSGTMEAGHKQTIEVNQPGLSNGMYMVRMHSQGKITTVRVAIHP